MPNTNYWPVQTLYYDERGLTIQGDQFWRFEFWGLVDTKRSLVEEELVWELEAFNYHYYELLSSFLFDFCFLSQLVYLYCILCVGYVFCEY